MPAAKGTVWPAARKAQAHPSRAQTLSWVVLSSLPRATSVPTTFSTGFDFLIWLFQGPERTLTIPVTMVRGGVGGRICWLATLGDVGGEPHAMRIDEEWVLGSTYTRPPSGDVWSCWWPLTPQHYGCWKWGRKTCSTEPGWADSVLYLIQIHIKTVPSGCWVTLSMS